jgi:hypothetical protein
LTSNLPVGRKPVIRATYNAGAAVNTIAKAHRAALGQEVSFIVVLSVQLSEKSSLARQ